MRKKLLSNVMLLLTMLFVGVGSALAGTETITFADLSLENSVQYSDPFTSGDVSVTFGGGGNDGKYYTTGSGIRTYGGGTITIEASGNTISEVKLTFSGASYAPAETTVWSCEGGSGTGTSGVDATWTGSATKVILTRPSGSGHWRLQSVEVTYASSGTQKIAIATDVTVKAPETVEIGQDGNFVLSATFASNEYTVAWESSNPEVLDVNGTYYDALAVGTAKVTVTITPDDEDTYKAVSKEFSVNVVDPNANDGSEDKPFTVAEAIAYINTLGSSTSPNAMYVSGIVSQVDSYNSKYSSITYWISDDGTTATQLEVYSGKGLNSADFDSQDDVTVGDVVTVCGYLKMYNNTPEFTQNNYLVSTTHQTVAKAETTVTIGGALTNLDVFTSTEAGQLTASVTSENVAVAGATVTWSSSNEQVATIDEDGNVTLVAKGTVKFTATYAGDATYKGSSATTDEYTVISTKPAPAAVVYSKVTSALQLVEGAEYLMVNEDAAVALGVVEKSGNNMIGKTESVTIENGQISITDEAVNVLTLTKSTYGDWNMAASLNEGKYLSWESGNTLSLGSSEGLAAARWTIEYADGVPTIVNASDNSRKLQYNSGSPRFATYTSSQKPVALYIKGEVVPVVAVGAAGWTSFVPAKNVAFPQGVNAYIVTANNTESVTLTVVDAVKAGTPVLVEAAEGEYALEVVEESACDDVTTNLLSASDGNVTSDGSSIYALGQKNNEVGLYLVADGVTIPAGKAYLDEVNGGGNGVKTFVFGSETAIQNVEAAANNAAIYNLAGQRVQKTVKGLYIQNGRKFIVK